MKNILLVYGHALSHCALRQLVNADHSLRQVDEVGSISEAMARVRKQSYALVILDVSAPEKNGLETFCDLKQLAPGLAILVINGSDQMDRMAHFIRLGCAGYLPYTSSSHQVKEAIKTIMHGRPYLLPAQQELVSGRHPMLHERLSLRELQVFFKLIKGQAVNAIAGELAIAPGSVSVFRSKILKKMEVPNNAALIHYALAHQLIPPMEAASKSMTLTA